MRPADYLRQRGMATWLAPYAGWLLDVLEANGIRYTVTSVHRSREKQTQLYQRWLAGQNKYPVAAPGTSYHEYGRAMDVTMDPPVYAQVGALWRKMGGVWSPNDEIHFHA